MIIFLWISNINFSKLRIRNLCSNLLEQEYSTYLDKFKLWVKEHLDEYVLIKDDQVVGFFASYEDALDQGLKRFGNVPFFIKIVKEKEEVHFFHQGVV